MTTPPTPAGWYPDHEVPGGQRYWDGTTWTEHRIPAPPQQPPAPPEPAEPQQPAEPAEPQQPAEPAEPQQPAEPAEPQQPAEPAEPQLPAEPAVFEPPTFETFETPSFESISAGSFETPAPPPPSAEAQAAATAEFGEFGAAAAATEAFAYSRDRDDTDTTDTATDTDAGPVTYHPPAPPASSTAAYTADATTDATATMASPVPGAYEPAAGWAAPDGGPDDRKLVLRYLGGIAALLVVLILILVYAFAIRDTGSGAAVSDTSQEPSPASESASGTLSGQDAPPAAAPPAAPGDGQVADGPFTFAISGTESGTTITSDVNEFLEKTAVGEFFVVYLTVGNTGAEPQNFASAQQVLKEGANTFAPDDEASSYMGGGVVTVNPGDVVETAVAFDIPAGTVPTAIEVHGVPGGPGVDLPL